MNIRLSPCIDIADSWYINNGYDFIIFVTKLNKFVKNEMKIIMYVYYL